MGYSDSIFKFVTIRNSSNEVKADEQSFIQPVTALSSYITEVLPGDMDRAKKTAAFNKKVEDFIKSGKFYKNADEIREVSSRLAGEKKKNNSTGKELRSFYENLYDNIVVRVVSKSNRSEVFPVLIHHLKKVHRAFAGEENNNDPQVVLPKGLVMSTLSAGGSEAHDRATAKQTKLQPPNAIKVLLGERQALFNKIEEKKEKARSEQDKMLAREALKQPTQKSQSTRKGNASASNAAANASLAGIHTLLNEVNGLEKKLEILEGKLSTAYTEAIAGIRLIPYVIIGGKPMDATIIEDKPAIIEADAIYVYAKGCYLKFPFQIADLRVIEQKVVGYLPNEIAHINNTQPGEKNIRTTRRLKRIEVSELFSSENEVTKETDTQSTEKFSLEKAASEINAEETSLSLNAGVSGTYGVVTASLDAGFSHSTSQESSNSSSQTYAREIVQKVVDRVSQKVKIERSTKTVEEFEETVKHIIDNTEHSEPKSYVYRWLVKLVRARLKNYGKRLILQLDIPHPSHYHLSRILKSPDNIKLPPDPKSFAGDGDLPPFSIESITRENYAAWEMLYSTKLEPPPDQQMILSYQQSATDGAQTVATELTIEKGYKATMAVIKEFYRKLSQDHLTVLVGRQGYAFWSSNIGVSTPLLLDGETVKLPISILQFTSGYHVNIEVICELTTKAYSEWQTKCYFAILEGYDALLAHAESRIGDFNAGTLNPSRKEQVIKTEIKKGAIQKMFRCDPFWVNDSYNAGEEYLGACCSDSLNAERVRFIENNFDWKNMSYELHPYFYNSHTAGNSTSDNWAKLLNLTDDDPHFELFLQASYATVRVPVHRDSQKEIAAINFILNNSIGNHSVVPDNIQGLLDDLKSDTPFGYIDETPTNIPFVTIHKEYDKTGNLSLFYMDADGNRVACTEVTEFDKEGNQTKFYYDAATNEMVISEIKEGHDEAGKKYYYYFNAANEKIITHKSKTETDIEGTSVPYYDTDLGIFNIPTDLVILEAGIQNGVEVRGYPEADASPDYDIQIPKQYSPSIIKK